MQLCMLWVKKSYFCHIFHLRPNKSYGWVDSVRTLLLKLCLCWTILLFFRTLPKLKKRSDWRKVGYAKLWNWCWKLLRQHLITLLLNNKQWIKKAYNRWKQQFIVKKSSWYMNKIWFQIVKYVLENVNCYIRQ